MMERLGRLGRRGSVSVMVAVCGLALLCLGGMAVDLERVWLVRGRLQASLDAAGLAAARNYSQNTCTTTCTDPNAVALFWAQFGRNGDIGPTGGTGFMSTTATSPVLTPVDATHLRITATATVPTILLGVTALYAGVSPQSNVTMSVSSVAQRGGTGLELALVIDTTRSMGQNDPATGTTDLQTAQSSVQTMLNTLYGTDQNGNSNDTVPNLWVSVVPFATAVNVGNSHTNWLGSYASSDYAGYGWQGCVNARLGPYDQSEDNPFTKPLPKYLDASTYGKWGTANGSGSLGPNNGAPGSGSPSPGANGCNYNTSYFYNASPYYCMGDNDWGKPSGSSNPASGAVDFSPNSGCNPTAILPLTASKATVMSSVNSLTTFNSLGTIIGTGVQAAWFTLSPLWSGLWGTANSPLPYHTAGIQKAMILLSDGGTNWGYFSANSGIAPENERIDGLYMPYGRLYDNQLSIAFTTSGGSLYNNQVATLNTANTELSRRWVATCTNMKAQGISIYVIGLGVANSTDRGNLQSCASGPAGNNSGTYYFESPTGAQLSAAMQGIASQLASLVLTQ